MPLSKAQGNMYDWVTHTWSVLQGECPHQCQYCYVKQGHYTKNSPAYKGQPRLAPNDMAINLGRDKTIFVCHMNDLFAEEVSGSLVLRVLEKCKDYPFNTYVFQTKNPGRLVEGIMPDTWWLGTTIETADDRLLEQMSKAPESYYRANGLLVPRYWMKNRPEKTFLTIEPIMRTPIHYMLATIELASPDWVNIGADSKGCKLPEPTWDEVQQLIDGIKTMGIEIRQKSNLERLKQNVSQQDKR